MERYQMTFPELPHYLTVFKLIDRNEDLVKVEVNSTIHVNKKVILPANWSMGYIRAYPIEFNSEVLSAIVKRYDLTMQPRRYA